jgi:hypothetical protein
MEGSAQRRRHNQRLFDGRIEKRRLRFPSTSQASEPPLARERTVTENISPHGARVISKRSWESGEQTLVTPLTGEFPQAGRVIYLCAKKERTLLHRRRVPETFGQMGRSSPRLRWSSRTPTREPHLLIFRLAP